MPSAIVIGGGPAGAVAGMVLARAKWDVTIVEQHAFPRSKVCGECVSSLGFEVLTRLGIAGAFQEAGAVSLERACLQGMRGKPAVVGLSRRMYGLSRWVMDPLLLDESIKAGAEVQVGWRCEEAKGGVVKVRDLKTNQVREMKADWVIMGDGKGMLTGRKTMATGDMGIKAHFEGVEAERDTIYLFGLEGHYLGLAAIEKGLWNVAYSVPADRLKEARGNLDELFEGMKKQSVGMGKAFGGSRRVSEWLASPLPRFGVAREWPVGVIPIGNAAAAMEPIGGEGMGLAMRSGEMAGEALVLAKGDRNHPAVVGLRREFDRLWMTRRAACRAGAVVMSWPGVAGTAVGMLNAIPDLGRISLALVGK